MALDVSKTFDRLRHDHLLHKLKSHGISGWVFSLILSFLSNIRLWVVLDCKSIQSMLEFLKAPILSSTHFFLHINDLSDDLSVILLSMLMILLPTLSVIRSLICGNN